MDGLMAATAAATATTGAAIPLDLISPLEPYRGQGGLSIRVERLPFKARLSKGRNNGDNSWSLTVDDIDGLQYLPPDDLSEPHNLTIRVIKIDSDSASTLMRFEIPIGALDPATGATPGTAATTPGEVSGAADYLPMSAEPAAQPDGLNGQVAPAQAPIATETAPPVNGGHTSVAEDHSASTALPLNGYAEIPQPAGPAPDYRQELELKLAEARAAWEAEHQARVAVAVQEAVRKAESEARIQLDQTTEVRLSLELERRLGEARASWEAELQGRIAIAVEQATQHAGGGAQTGEAIEAQIAVEAERRLTEARASWDVEHQEAVAAAVHEAVLRAQSDTRTQLDQTNEARLAQELEQQMAHARASWEAELQGRVAVAVEDATRRAETDARTRMGQENEAQIAQEVERRLAEARASWDAEYQGRVAVAVQEAVQRAESDTRAQIDQSADVRLAQELDRQLADARASWEAELQGRIGSAVQDAVQRTQAEARAQMEQARQEWQNGAGQELAEMTARCTQAESALAEARTQVPMGEDTEGALRGLRDELASAQALIRARESELSELRQSGSHGDPDMSRRLADAEANLERSRTAWHAEREELLARAEEGTQERIKQALERWQHETQAALTKAKQEWLDAEETRFAVAEAQWRENIGIAKSRAPVTPMVKRGRRLRVTARFKRFAVITACLAAAYMLYPRIEPIVVTQWWPKIIAYKNEVEPPLRAATMEFKAWATDLLKRAEASRKPSK